MDWVLLFVVRTALGAWPMSGMPAIYFQTYAACKATAQKFNGAQPHSVMAQQRLAVCESLGDQKPDADDEKETEDP
jgi:hypothetical protein